MYVAFFEDLEFSRLKDFVDKGDIHLLKCSKTAGNTILKDHAPETVLTYQSIDEKVHFRYFQTYHNLIQCENATLF